MHRESTTSGVIRKSMDLICGGGVILRLIDSTVSRKDEMERAAERVNQIKLRWPKQNEITVPEGLRQVRNDYEHFDTKINNVLFNKKKV